MKKMWSVLLSVMLLTGAVWGVAIAADEVVIMGTVNEENLLVNESGEAFILAETDEGIEVKSMVGKKVQVTGTVEEADGQKTVTITEYEVME
ncbi:MAG: hypothetical protein PVH30_13250 [Desulfobacterales bacterium]|jgi:hypothetical protein